MGQDYVFTLRRCVLLFFSIRVKLLLIMTPREKERTGREWEAREKIEIQLKQLEDLEVFHFP